MPKATLVRLATRLKDPEYDSRHAILDIATELLALEQHADELPASLRPEFIELLREVRDVRPQFPSRRNTSPLFDRAGMGQIGRQRAERLVRRLVSLAEAIQK